MGKEAQALLKHLAYLYVATWDLTYSQVRAYLNAKVCIACLRAAHCYLCGSHVPSICICRSYLLVTGNGKMEKAFYSSPPNFLFPLLITISLFPTIRLYTTHHIFSLIHSSPKKYPIINHILDTYYSRLDYSSIRNIYYVSLYLFIFVYLFPLSTIQ